MTAKLVLDSRENGCPEANEVWRALSRVVVETCVVAAAFAARWLDEELEYIDILLLYAISAECRHESLTQCRTGKAKV